VKYTQKTAFCITVLLVLISVILSLVIPQGIIKTIVSQSGVFAPVVFIATILITYVFLPFSGTPVVFVGFILFGKNVLFLIYIALTISAAIDFYIARKWGREVIEAIIGKKVLKRAENHIRKYEYKMLFLIRLLLGEMYIAASYASGLTTMRFYPYFMISLVASFPLTIAQYTILSKVNNPYIFVLISYLILGVFTIAFMLGILIKKYFNDLF